VFEEPPSREASGTAPGPCSFSVFLLHVVSCLVNKRIIGGSVHLPLFAGSPKVIPSVTPYTWQKQIGKGEMLTQGFELQNDTCCALVCSVTHVQNPAPHLRERYHASTVFLLRSICCWLDTLNLLIFATDSMLAILSTGAGSEVSGRCAVVSLGCLLS